MAYNYNSSRLSTFSSVSGVAPRPGNQPSAQVSTQTLLNALHTSFTSWQWHPLESSTSLVVNTWKTASEPSPVDGRIGGTVDQDLARKAWEHARRRAEDGCVVLCSTHNSTPSMIAPFASALPIHAPESFYTALNVIRAFTHCVTPFNPSFPRYSSLAATFNLSMVGGEAIGATLALSKSGIDTKRGLLHIPSEPGYRAFDVFYYLNVSSASEGEREFLGLKPYSKYELLKKSGTFSPPKYMPTADDEAAAEAFRDDLKAIGIKGVQRRNLISALTGLLKLGDTLDDWASDDIVDMIYDDVAGLLDTQKMVLETAVNTADREVFISGMYEALVDWVIARANEAIRRDFKAFKGRTSDVEESGLAEDDLDEDAVNITVLSIPSIELGKAVALHTVFDDADGINAEMKADGVPVQPAGASVLKEMKDAAAACEPDLGIFTGASGREVLMIRDHREGVLERLAQHCQADSYMKEVLHPQSGQGVVLGTYGRFDLANTLASSRVWFHLCLHPTDDSPATLDTSVNPWSAGAVSTQIRQWRLPEWANRRNKHLDYTVDFDFEEFVTRYAQLGCKEGREGIDSWLLERGWCNGEVIVGSERVWVREAAWWEAECMIDKLAETREDTPDQSFGVPTPMESPYPMQSPGMSAGFFGPAAGDDATIGGSRDNLLQPQQSTNTLGMKDAMGRQSVAPTMQTRNISGGDYGLGTKGDTHKGISYEGGLDPELGDGRVMVERKQTTGRRLWVIFVWMLTWWIPSPVLRYAGRMKRPDVRMAWREKVVLVFLILIINGIVVFYIIEFGRLLCPNFDKAWNEKEVGFHQGNNDFWVSHAGFVYDLSKFWRTQHSDTAIETTSQNMLPFAGTDVTEYIRPPLNLACPDLVSSDSMQLQSNNTLIYPQAEHTSGPFFQPNPQTALRSQTWYNATFLPKMRTFYKGDLVWSKSTVHSQGQNQQRMWFIYENGVYDLTDYFYTQNLYQGSSIYKFFPSELETLVQENPGLDITSNIQGMNNATAKSGSLQCLNNYFYVGLLDFRDEPRCQVNNYILLAFTIILCTVILTKFLAALQLGSKKRPAAQDKFVICQVPAYTEGEDHLRKSLDSLTSLAYDNKRKLICVICDGMIVGGGNDRPTPKIVLDILGVDPKIDPPALPFKSVGQGSEQLNYGKVYSGLYEFEGNVVPYIVVVKVGKESEYNSPKPGNRGKRDSQILIMNFLSRVHHRSAMSPLELEMFHQINNIIGVDPELYEYLLMVDADTSVKEDSLNRLVAACANDNKVAGICGETSLENEERSWWTMIQVYEYYISHHLAKAFESLFGSVTCLPGCFCMYRLRTADKGKPLIIDEKVIRDYSDGEVDTLHKKNLLQLGEDRYLTTLMTKHFPNMSYKFESASHAYTAAPSEFSVLLSQRRRWINSTIHNLAELMWLKDMCGFCCFSMRFVVFIDLCGTIILPATCAYLGYLIYRAASHSGQFPIISIIMLAAVYGLQAIIFLIKRQWQHIGWMIIYIIAFPVYAFLLPLYSFWRQDDFSWGNTRVVVGESGQKKLIATSDEGFDPRSIPLQRWDDYAAANNLPGRRGLAHEKSSYDDGPAYEMDDMRSEYSSAKPASTIFAGFPTHAAAGVYMPPTTPATPFGGAPRASTYSLMSAGAGGAASPHERLMSMGGLSDIAAAQSQSPYGGGAPPARPISTAAPDALAAAPSPRASTVNLLGAGGAAGARLSRGPSPGARASQLNFMDGPKSGPSDADIVMAVRECLQSVDLDTVTKKMVRALVEQRLCCQLAGEKRAFLDGVIDTELATL